MKIRITLILFIVLSHFDSIAINIKSIKFIYKYFVYNNDSILTQRTPESEISKLSLQQSYFPFIETELQNYRNCILNTHFVNGIEAINREPCDIILSKMQEWFTYSIKNNLDIINYQKELEFYTVLLNKRENRITLQKDSVKNLNDSLNVLYKNTPEIKVRILDSLEAISKHKKDSIYEIEKINIVKENLLLEKKQRTQAEHDRALRKEKLIEKYGIENADIILGKKVRVGFTDDMCREAWGRPEDINRTTSKYGRSEQWVYPGGSILYFEDGVLTTIQN